jgi:hypothetical protein
MTSASPSLYRRLFGERFDALPPALRDLHDVPAERRFTARFRITRGRGWLKALVCRSQGLPRAGEEVPLTLVLRPDGAGERWERRFPDVTMTSRQWQAGELLVESFGLLRLGFELVREGDTLHLVLRRAWLLGLRWPLFLAPRIDAVEAAEPDGCAVRVRIALPLLGLLIQYEGKVRPETPG